MTFPAHGTSANAARSVKKRCRKQSEVIRRASQGRLGFRRRTHTSVKSRPPDLFPGTGSKRHDDATTALRASMHSKTGSQSARSLGLGVAAFTITPRRQYPTTSQARRGTEMSALGRTTPARAKMTAAIAKRSPRDTAGSARIRGGNAPRHLPPRVNSPHGAPKIKASWNAHTARQMSAKRIAAAEIIAEENRTIRWRGPISRRATGARGRRV